MVVLTGHGLIGLNTASQLSRGVNSTYQNILSVLHLHPKHNEYGVNECSIVPSYQEVASYKLLCIEILEIHYKEKTRIGSA